MPKQFFRGMALLALAAGQGAWAQNSDLGLLLGISAASSSVSATSVRSSVGASVQINYAYQIFGSRLADLYLEFPFVVSAGQAAEVSRAGISASNGATLLFTPGVRVKLPLHARLALYGAAGAGVGGFGGNQVVVSLAGSVNTGRSASPAVDFGGGIDLRLTRLLSLRGEFRDFISLGGLGGTSGRHHVIGQGGLAFHF